MDKKTKLYQMAAGTVGFGILGSAIGWNPLGQSLILIAALFLLGFFVVALSGIKWKKDVYDLAVLRQVQEREERRAIEDEIDEIDSAGNAVCLNCATHFDPALNKCPRCGKSLFGCC